MVQQAIDTYGRLDISIVTSAKNDSEGSELLKSLGMPFRKSSSDSTNQQEAA